ncbi:hypothetical protein MXB_473 [Myxobolus squamalis]|nr:hypothetical protein MXB_473 [Myxobolus squamalis]
MASILLQVAKIHLLHYLMYNVFYLLYFLIVSTAFDGSIKIWDVSNDTLNELHQKSVDTPAKKDKYETPLMVIGHHNAPAAGVCAFDEAKILTCGWDAAIKMWDISSASCVSTLVFLLNHNP